jgi:hypothetical protein
VAVATWNVNEKFINKKESLFGMLHLEDKPDIICVG